MTRKTINPVPERHPFPPFLPAGATHLFLGSFPPQPKRWSMPFFYPNWSNDFWRVMGIIFHADRDYFAVAGEKRFDIGRVQALCREKGIALYDTAREVRRLQDNASDKFLEVVTPTDIPALLAQIPACTDLITTGQKATDIIADAFHCPKPPIGSYVRLLVGERALRFWRMPSTSRAYPLPLSEKAGAYRRLFPQAGEGGIVGK
ncbi:MAG: uracil-DNA glycosylase family protein [Bacteroidales bacterium]|nr:uracil-DNA glycosylase family protein [Bacteroidales bacterium]